MSNWIEQQLGNYRLIRRLGKGSFGQVYLGEHIYLKTQAAIKLLLEKMDETQAEALRTAFLQEAQRIAALKHPHILRVLEFGIEASTPYLVMEYAAHGTLLEQHPRGTKVPVDQVVSYTKQIAQALHYAHESRLIHRDVKPANVLLDERDTVLLGDFGIATLAHHTASMRTSAYAGTAAYMAPEQLQGKPVPASDQYALGIMVYEWLCGQLPYQGDPIAVGMQHLTAPLPSLRKYNEALSPTIEAVVHQAMAKNPRQRFTNAETFATALEQASEPTQFQIATLRRALDPTVTTIPPTQHSSSPTTILSSSSALSLPPSSTNIASTKTLLNKRRIALIGLLGLAATSIANNNLIRLIHYFSPSGSTTKSIAALTPTPPPIGTTFYTYRGYSDQIRVLAWSPDGKRIASGSDDTTARVWDAFTENNTVIYHGHSSYVEGVAWSPDGKRIASGSADTSVQIWNPSNGNLTYTYRGHSLWVNRVSWSPDGKYIASGEQSSMVGRVVEVRVWDANTGSTLVIYHGHTNGVFAIAWSPDGKYIASDGYDGTVQVWEATTGKSISTYTDKINHFGLSWSPDSKYVAVGGLDPRVLVLNANTGDLVSTYDSHTKAVGDVAWSPDGRHIAAGCDDHTVQIWEVSTGKIVFTYQGHSDWLSAVIWSPDSKRIASGSHDTTVRVWQAL